MITMLVGRPKFGKTGWLQMKVEDLYFNHRHELWKQCCGEIVKENNGREIQFECPEKDTPPIYAPLDMGSRFRVKRDEYYEPFIVNPYHLSPTNKGVAPQYFLPYAQIFIPEAQKYFSSKQHQNLDPGVYSFFEKHGHKHYDIWLDSQVGGFVDARIRQLVGKVIEIIKMTFIYDGMGGVIKTIWECREFDCIQDYDEYFKSPGTVKNYKETTYEHEGDIRKHYNAFGCKDELTPPDGQQYSMLKPVSASELSKMPKEIAQFYSIHEPEYYRKKLTEKTEEGTKNAKRIQAVS